MDNTAGRSKTSCELLLATIGDYNATTGSTLVFDGESSPTTKRYKRLSGTTYSAGQRVLVAKITGTYVILGIVS